MLKFFESAWVQHFTSRIIAVDAHRNDNLCREERNIDKMLWRFTGKMSSKFLFFFFDKIIKFDFNFWGERGRAVSKQSARKFFEFFWLKLKLSNFFLNKFFAFTLSMFSFLRSILRVSKFQRQIFLISAKLLRWESNEWRAKISRGAYVK